MLKPKTKNEKNAKKRDRTSNGQLDSQTKSESAEVKPVVKKQDRTSRTNSQSNVKPKETLDSQPKAESGEVQPAAKKQHVGRGANMPFFAPTLRLKVEGFNQTRMLNALSGAGVSVRRVRVISARTLTFDMSKKDSEKTFAILQKMCYDYSIIAESGLHALPVAFLRHIGLAAGALVFAVLLALSTQIVWRIEISGNEAVDSQLIMRELESSGLKVGALKKKIDLDAVTASIRNMGGVAEGTVQLKGTTVVINVVEEKAYIPPAGGEESGDIVSLYDAEITRMTVKQGTAQVNVGSRVAAGAVLVKGERLNSLGEVMGEAKASGKIYGKVTFHEKHIFSKTERILVRTGNKKSISQASILGLKIGSNGEKYQSGGWESVSESAKTFFLPIKITRTVYYETAVEDRERDIDAYVDTLKSAAVLNSAIKAGASGITTTTTLTAMDGDLLMLNIYVQAEILIGEG